MNDSSKGMLVGLIVLALAVAGGIWYATGNNDDETVEQTVSTQTDNQEQVGDTAPAETANTIVDLAIATPDLSTLVTAVTEADLADTLSGEGPFTVFAPTNAAFEALPEGTLDSLLLAENQSDLQDVLTYHVVAGEVLSSDLSDGQVVETLQGGELTVKINEEGVFLMDAAGGMSQVVTADVEASNGVVHIIDSVLLQ